MPVSDKIYQQMLDEYNYDPDYSVKCIEANRHNQITATYHLLTKKALKRDKNFQEETHSTSNIVGSLDRGKQPTRVQQENKLDKEKAQFKAQFGVSGNAQKRGQSIAVTGNQRDNLPTTQIQATQNMATLNLGNVKNEITNVSAQKKYKLELQAEINKLKQKHPDKIQIGDQLSYDRTHSPVGSTTHNAANKNASRTGQINTATSNHDEKNDY